MDKLENIYWVTETEDYGNYISMQSPYMNFLPPWQCLPAPIPVPCPNRRRRHKKEVKTLYIDNSNSINVKQENRQIITGNTIGDGAAITGGDQGNTSTVDAVQVSVIVVVPIIDSFDEEQIIPINAAGEYRVAAGGQNLDIRVDGNGTYVNGEKLEGSQLEDGTRVYIYRKDSNQTVTDKK
jgi:hypothetical protein